MAINENELKKLIEKEFGISRKENKNSLDTAVGIINTDNSENDKNSLTRLANFFKLNPNSKTDFQKISNFITTVKSS